MTPDEQERVLMRLASHAVRLTAPTFRLVTLRRQLRECARLLPDARGNRAAISRPSRLVWQLGQSWSAAAISCCA